MNQDVRHAVPVTEHRPEDRHHRRLPEGWQAIGRCRQGLTGPNGCLVLAHARLGIALIDVAPAITPSAEGRIRRLLAGGAVPDDALPSYLPIGHLRIEPAEWSLLPRLLEATFAALPPMAADAGGGRWIDAVREVLAGDPAWMATGQRGGAAPPLRAATVHLGGMRSGAPVRVSWLAYGLVFAVGLVAGRLLLPARTAEAPVVPAPVGIAATPGGQASPFQAALVFAGPDLPALAAEAEFPPAAAQPGGAAQAAVPGEPPRAASPIVAEPPPPRRAASSAPRPPSPPTLDRRCAEAMFRWQQGAWVGWAEMAYLRQGCEARTR